MSGAVKAVKKAFKKVVKVVKKYAAPILAVGALVFTGGAALGLAGMAGGWGAAATAATAKLGATGVLGNVLTGAITQAGYGALAGGAIAEATGGDFKDGLETGAVTGGIAGGIGGALGSAGKAAQGLDKAAATDPATIAAQGADKAATAQAGNAISQANPATHAVSGAGAAPTGAAGAAPGAAAAPAGSGGLLSKTGKFISDNQELLGHTVAGIGKGLLTDSQDDGERNAVRERYRQIRKNYGGVDPGTGYRDLAPGDSQLAPNQRFNASGYRQFEYQFNPKSGRIERVPV